jgi:hypothetical protein
VSGFSQGEIGGKMVSMMQLQGAGSIGKKALCAGALMGLGATFELASKLVPAMKDELADWAEGLRVAIGVLPDGPTITVAMRGGGIRSLGFREQPADLSIMFKNLDSAVLVFTGQIGAPRAVAENRLCVRGNNTDAMKVTRGMAIVQTYLFPGMILDKTFKTPPRLTPREMATKAVIMSMLVPKMAGMMLR